MHTTLAYPTPNNALANKNDNYTRYNETLIIYIPINASNSFNSRSSSEDFFVDVDVEDDVVDEEDTVTVSRTGTLCSSTRGLAGVVTEISAAKKMI